MHQTIYLFLFNLISYSVLAKHRSFTSFDDMWISKDDGFDDRSGKDNLNLNISNEKYWKSEHYWEPIGDNNQIGMIIAGNYEIIISNSLDKYITLDLLAGNTRKAICSNRIIKYARLEIEKQTTAMDLFSFYVSCDKGPGYQCVGISSHDYRTKKGTLLDRVKIMFSY